MLKSKNVHKKHRSQFERHTHKRLVQLKCLSGPTTQVFVDYVLRMIPPGVDVKLGLETIESLSADSLQALGRPDTSVSAASSATTTPASVRERRVVSPTSSVPGSTSIPRPARVSSKMPGDKQRPAGQRSAHSGTARTQQPRSASSPATTAPVVAATNVQEDK